MAPGPQRGTIGSVSTETTPAPRETSDVRRLLRYLNDPRELRRNALVAHLFESQGERTPKAQANVAAMARLRELLKRALERLEPHAESSPRAAARDRRLYTILMQCDIAGEKHETVARELGLSLRQFYRERNAAFARLQDSLQAELTLSDAAGREQESTSPGTVRHNLPWQPTSFIGRRREIEEIAGLLGQRRLVTITGSGGTGKTRTALEVASRATHLRDGTWFVDLAAVYDDAFVLGRLVSVLDLRLPENENLLGSLADAIKGREMLLILDNCEHVLEPVRAVAGAILRACPQVALLATSRERLGISGEIIYQLSTLPVPGKDVATAAEGRSYAAFELFVERAATAQHGVEFSDEHFEAAADICRRLDGIALAIELAAARLPVLGIAELRRQVAEHFRVIAGGCHDVPARQQTLYSAISWSYDLLSDLERVLFRRLSIFASGWTLDAAVSVCTDDTLTRDSVLDALFSLVEKSLVVVDLDTATQRYSFFESTRSFASQKLAATDELSRVARRHAEWMAAFADSAYEAFLVTNRSRWGAAVAPEIDNVLAALEWGFGPEGDTITAARIASGLTGLWLVVGLTDYGRRFVNAAFDRIDASRHPLLAARLLLAQSQFTHGAPNERILRQAAALLEPLEDRRMLARCYTYLAYAVSRMGRNAEAEEISYRASALFENENLQRSPLYARCLNDRSVMLRMQGKIDDAKGALAQALSVAIALQDDWSTALCQSLLAEIEFTAGDPHRAVEIGKQALASARRVRQEVFSLANLACFLIAIGEIDAAEAYVREALSLSLSNPNDVQAAVLQHSAAIAAIRGKAAPAARLAGYVNAWYERFGCVRDATDQKGYDLLMEAIRKQMSDADLSALAAQGARLTQEAAIDEALRLS